MLWLAARKPFFPKGGKSQPLIYGQQKLSSWGRPGLILQSCFQDMKSWLALHVYSVQKVQIKRAHQFIFLWEPQNSKHRIPPHNSPNKRPCSEFPLKTHLCESKRPKAKKDQRDVYEARVCCQVRGSRSPKVKTIQPVVAFAELWWPLITQHTHRVATWADSQWCDDQKDLL